MGEATVVNLAFGVTFGMIAWYAGRLHMRYRRIIRRLDQDRG
jgi:hypothetical protein